MKRKLMDSLTIRMLAITSLLSLQTPRGEAVVHPAQSRKLAQARKPGDKVKLVFYRGGKKHTQSATLEPAPAWLGLLDEGGGDEKLRQLHRALLELPQSEALRAQAKALR